jgi:hypothetical protein
VKLTHLSCGEEENRRHSVVLRRTLAEEEG